MKQKPRKVDQYCPFCKAHRIFNEIPLRAHPTLHCRACDRFFKITVQEITPQICSICELPIMPGTEFYIGKLKYRHEKKCKPTIFTGGMSKQGGEITTGSHQPAVES